MTNPNGEVREPDWGRQIAYRDRMIRVLRARIVEIESDLIESRTYATELEEILTEERQQAAQMVKDLGVAAPDESVEVGSSED